MVHKEAVIVCILMAVTNRAENVCRAGHHAVSKDDYGELVSIRSLNTSTGLTISLGSLK